MQDKAGFRYMKKVSGMAAILCWIEGIIEFMVTQEIRRNT